MVYLKSEQEIELMRKSAQLVSLTHAEVAKYIKHGVATSKLDLVAEEFIKQHNAKPAFKGYGPRSNPFPYTLCISVNDSVVHGFPGNYELQHGDIVSVDCGINLNGYFGDVAYTYIVGECDPETFKLLTTTAESLYRGIEQAVHGNTIGDIGNAVQKHCENAGYGVVRDLVGHGLGKSLHEDPSVPNFGRAGRGKRLRSGMTLAIEPMINKGSWKVKTLKDGWTIVTADGSVSAHYEHDVVVREGEAEILSTFQYIEEITKIQIDQSLTHG
ncbi:MAG: type I methionyl aminopeptidase [Balneolales bacterium]|nr:type I methionyl aminopeptidase [Balneolales bacterium]